MKTVLTTCPFCACGCALYLNVKDGKLVGTAPSEHHPVSRGRLCARGWHAHEAPAWGERLTRPMIRKGDSLVPVSWSEALSHAVERISKILASGKSVGVLGSSRATNEENFLAAKLARNALGTPHIDSCLRSTYQPVIAGMTQVSGEPQSAGTLEDIENSDIIFLMEGDLARTHPQAACFVVGAVERGARLVTFGRVKTQMSRLGALHVPVVDGNGIPHLVAATLNYGLTRSRLTLERAEGYEVLRSSVATLTPSEPLRLAAEWYARAERASILLPAALGGEQARRDAVAFTTLAAITGHLGRPGSPVLPLPVRWNLRGACEMGVTPEFLPGYEPVADEAVGGLKSQGVSGRNPARGDGVDAQAMLDTVSALIVVADDPPSLLPMGKTALAAMARMECVVALDAFSTPTTRAAEVVLPIASFAETDGTSTSLEGRVQRVQACVEPPGEARPGWRVLAELLEKFGASAAYRSADEVTREIVLAVPPYSEVDAETLKQGWGTVTDAGANGHKPSFHELELPRKGPEEFPKVLVWDGVFDWGSDPLVASSPTLTRDYLSRRKLFPNGIVELATKDADAMGVRQGWQVRVVSEHGEAVLPVSLRADLEPGVLLVPYAFRDHAAAVTHGQPITRVRVERV